MSVYSKTLKHVNHKDFRRTHQRHLGEQEVLRKIEKEKLIQEKKELEEIKKISSPLKSNWRKDLLREFGEWVPIANAGGPTMGTSTTFGYYSGGTPVINGETGQPITYTASGLGGSDSLPTTVTIDTGGGDFVTVAAPTYSQLSLAGYASPLPFFRRDDYKDVNAMLDASQEYARRVLADVFMAARVEDDRRYREREKQRSEMRAKISNYASTLGIDFEELQQKKSQIDKYGRLVSLCHDGITSLNNADNAIMRIYHPAKDAEGNVLKIYDAGVKTYRELRKLGIVNIESDPYSDNFRTLDQQFDPDRLIQAWGNVAGLAHSTDFGSGHDPNKIGEVLVGPKIVGPKKVGPKSDNTISADAEKLSPEDYAAYKNGGGDAAVKSGKTVQQVIDQGKKNLGQYDSGPRRTSFNMNDFRSAADYAAYKKGGGDAAVKKGKSIQDIVNQGKKNLGQYDSGPRGGATPKPPAGGGMGGMRGSGRDRNATLTSSSPGALRISPDDEKFIKDLSILPKIANVAGGLGLPGDLAIRYAKGDYRPVTKSPGSIFDNQVLDLISRSMKMKGLDKNSVPDEPYSLVSYPQQILDAPVRGSLGKFNYQITPKGVRVNDTFNFNDNTNIGALEILNLILKPIYGTTTQKIADRLVDIGDKRARSLGFNPDDTNLEYPLIIQYQNQV